MISLLALRMAPFMGHLSVAETMGKVYGKYPRVITALSNIFAAVFVIAAQISVVPFAVSMCIESVDSYIITLCSILVFVAYTALGGIRSVTVTDVLQFIIFTIIIALLAKFMFAKTGKTAVEIVSFLSTQKKFQFGGVLHVDNFDIKPIDLVEAILSGLVVYRKCNCYAESLYGFWSHPSQKGFFVYQFWLLFYKLYYSSTWCICFCKGSSTTTGRSLELYNS